MYNIVYAPLFTILYISECPIEYVEYGVIAIVRVHGPMNEWMNA